jgi:hypothetical protein
VAQTNLGGLAGAAIGSLAGYGVALALGKAGQPPVDSFAWGAAAGCFAASMFGLLYDRSVVPDFRKSYKALTRHYARGERGPDYDPRERVAMFGIPIAFATFIIPIVTAMLWFVVWYSARQGASKAPSMQWFATYFIAGVVGVALTMIIGNATTENRLLQREIAFNTTPVAQTAQQTAAVATPDAPPTEAELAQLRKRGRRDAVICIIGGVLLLAFNHYLALKEGKFYPKLVFGGPMITMCGIFGLFEPRVMTRHLPVGKHYPKTILLLVLLAIAIGTAIGWPIYAYYRG